MKTSNRAHALAALATSYAAERVRVDAAYRRMREIAATPHSPAQAREAARELGIALQKANAAATRARKVAAGAAASPAWHVHARPRRASRAVPAAVRPWSAELRRLTDIAVWLRRTILDDKGVHLPDAVRVANYAAKGPHIAGLDFGNQAAEQRIGPRIGVNLMATIDGTDPRVANTPSCPSPAVPATAKTAA